MCGRFSTIIKGTLFAVILTIILAFALAAVMYFFDIPDTAAIIAVFALAAISAAGGAFAAARAAGTKGLATGGAVGLLYYVILCIAALIIKKELAIDMHMAIMLTAVAASGMLGGIFGVSG